MFTHLVFWPWFTGLTFLIAGLIAVRKELVAARGLDKLIVLGPVFVAAPLATFGAEHLVMPQVMREGVPVWMPARLFWAYFVGFALIAAATSLVANRFIRLSGTLLGVMFLLFVLMIHLPNALAEPKDRLGWTIVLRETAFAGGAWALAGSWTRGARTGTWKWMIVFGRLSMAFAAIFFGIQQLLHADFAPGVPSAKLTPAGVPLHAWWGYPVGAVLLVTGVALLLNSVHHQRPRTAGVWIGVLMTLLTAGLYLPILLMTRDPSQMIEAINYVFDTLMFGGMALLVARAMSAE